MSRNNIRVWVLVNFEEKKRIFSAVEAIVQDNMGQHSERIEIILDMASMAYLDSNVANFLLGLQTKINFLKKKNNMDLWLKIIVTGHGESILKQNLPIAGYIDEIKVVSSDMMTQRQEREERELVLV